MELIATISTGAQETRKPNSSIRPVAVDRLPADRQAFVLGMVQWNLFPKGCHRPPQRSHRMFTVMEPLSCGQTGIGHGVSGVGFCRF